MKNTHLLPRRPYLLRAFYAWLLDNQLTPYILVNVTIDTIIVPMKFVNDGHIVLNIAPCAVVNLVMNNNEVRFNASFSGVHQQVVISISAIIAIYAIENNVGTVFEPEKFYDKQIQIDQNNCSDNNYVNDIQATTPIISSGKSSSLRIIK